MSNQTKEDPYKMNTSTLAFLGDAVYELYIRDIVVNLGIVGVNDMNRISTKYVRAESQAAAIKEMMKGFLTEDELTLVKRARNHKTPNRSRSAGPVEYKLATAFEALVGYCYLSGDSERLNEIMNYAATFTENNEEQTNEQS